MSRTTCARTHTHSARARHAHALHATSPSAYVYNTRSSTSSPPHGHAAWTPSAPARRERLAGSHRRFVDFNGERRAVGRAGLLLLLPAARERAVLPRAEIGARRFSCRRGRRRRRGRWLISAGIAAKALPNHCAEGALRRIHRVTGDAADGDGGRRRPHLTQLLRCRGVVEDRSLLLQPDGIDVIGKRVGAHCLFWGDVATGTQPVRVERALQLEAAAAPATSRRALERPLPES